MKVKLKKTKEIINIAEYDSVKLDVCDSYGCTVEVPYDDIEQFYDDNGLPLGMSVIFPSVIENNSNIDWQQVRIQAAIAAMQGFVTSDKFFTREMKELAKWSVGQADALIEELKKNPINNK